MCTKNYRTNIHRFAPVSLGSFLMEKCLTGSSQAESGGQFDYRIEDVFTADGFIIEIVMDRISFNHRIQ